ncbi:hypothetical protein MMC29_004361 [Sticta canariensis]|nr:hypothetical protein [Sticta canariensis]
MYSFALFLAVFLFASSFLPTLSTPIQPFAPVYVSTFYQFPVGTWLEDMAVRQNGKILTTSLTSPELLEVDRPTNPARVVHTFGDKTSCTGIWRSFAHLSKDVFYVIAGTMDLNPLSFGPVRGSWSVYRVALRHHHRPTRKPARVSLVADFPASIMLNGIAELDSKKRWLLVGDSSAGIVYRLHEKSGKVVQVLDDPLMKPKKADSGSATFGVGINRMEAYMGYLYFTNTDRNIFARIAIHEDGTSKGLASEVITHLDSPTGFISGGGHIYFAQHGDNRLAIVLGNKVIPLTSNVTDGGNEPLFGPTALALGGIQNEGDDYAGKIFISTNGGTAQYLTGEYTRGGTISMISMH